MEQFQWDARYSVNIAQIDEQHKNLLAVISQLDHGLKVGQSRKDLQVVFDGLFDYVQNHFKTEEEILAHHHFSALKEHRLEHDEFRRKLTQFHDAFYDSEKETAQDMMRYLASWLKTHVFLTDRKYSAFLNERGVH